VQIGTYYTLSEYLRTELQGKIQKISVDGGFGCPCRCSYCNNKAFSPSYTEPETGGIAEQIREGKRFFKKKGQVKGYLAYFQAHTNTLGNIRHMISLYEEALEEPDILGLVIATRPDCLPDELLDWFEQRFGNKARANHPFLLIELGVESTNDDTLEAINRGHNWDCARNAILKLDERGLNVGVHLIIGLPGETEEDYTNHIKRISELPVKTLKLHQLQIIRDTPMAGQWERNPELFRLFSAEEYARLIAGLLENLRPDIALDRFVSEAPQNMILAPGWGMKPAEFNKLLGQILQERFSLP